MRFMRMAVASVTVLTVVAVSSCASAERETVVSTDRTPVQPVCNLPANGPLPRTDARTIGSDGGTLRVGPHSLTIPGGALSAPVELRFTEHEGDHVRVSIEAGDGTTVTFDRAATLAIHIRPRCPGSVKGRGLDIWREPSQQLHTWSGGFLGLNPSKRVTKIDHNSFYIIAD